MKALHFGAGNIGRGFIGKLLADAGVRVTFADIEPAILQALNARHRYPVHVVGDEQQRMEMVEGVDGLDSRSAEAVACVAQVDLITTAVGSTILKRIAPAISQGLARRRASGNVQALNIIACENMVRATSQLRDAVYALLDEDLAGWTSQHVGFVDSTVDRIVPPAQSVTDDVLAVTVETFSEWIVDKTQFIGQPPQIGGMELTDNLLAFVERKLFTLNTGHAITAYLGNLAGYHTIHDAILDESIRKVVTAAMQESGAVLVRRYGFDPAQHAAYIEKILQRFANPWLYDDVQRVGRQPLRKLGAGDRLIKPLCGALEYGLPYDNLVRGIAAALCFRSKDRQSQKLEQLLEQQGVAATLVQLSGLAADSPIVAQIVAQVKSMRADIP